MAAYVIANIEVTDPEGYEEYRRMAGPALRAFGGRFLARGGDAHVLEGGWQPRRVVVLEFDSLERAREWWSSEQYAAAREVRGRTARTEMILVDGV